MFGYVTINKSELKFKEFDQYRRYYCGLCRRLKKLYGRRGQMTLSYDMTFLVLLLSGLYEPEYEKGKRRCLAHPWKKQEYLYNICTDYGADMTALLTYYKCIDDFKDEKKWFRKLYAAGLKKKASRWKGRYEEKIKCIEEAMNSFSRIEQEAAEKENCENMAYLDTLAHAFGQVLSQVFSFSPFPKEEIWLESLAKIGYDIGRFLYVVDAYDDLERDRKKGCFNPLFYSHRKGEALDDWIEDVLRNFIAGAAKEFEKLPILEDVGILRNVLYSGIWSRFYQVREQRRNKKEKEAERQDKKRG